MEYHWQGLLRNIIKKNNIEYSLQMNTTDEAYLAMPLKTITEYSLQ